VTTSVRASFARLNRHPIQGYTVCNLAGEQGQSPTKKVFLPAFEQQAFSYCFRLMLFALLAIRIGTVDIAIAVVVDAVVTLLAAFL
jgi:hypothetical protein